MYIYTSFVYASGIMCQRTITSAGNNKRFDRQGVVLVTKTVLVQTQNTETLIKIKGL